ncbi:MAG: 50S ribosomal protein L6 [Candidatus Altiarchaeales archaeon IMC4]|nr:ribosomal protein L6 [uncultured archaeon]ODS41929.1 MAG: 50S ribosomal protein L6 [Candidatus Altiarchaeales archaeon IMC4]
MDASLDIPEGIGVEVDKNLVKVKGPKGEVERRFGANVKISKKDNEIILSVGSSKRKEAACLGSVAAHIKNMMGGVARGVNYKLKILYSHFPMTVKVHGDEVLIDNFLGEKYPRKSRILPGVKVGIKGQDITVDGIDKEAVAQTAANIEYATKIRGRDPRVFQDGIYLTEKDGKHLK